MSADRKFAWDKDFPAFGLQTTATGHRLFLFRYRAGSISRRMMLDGSWLRHAAANYERHHLVSRRNRTKSVTRSWNKRPNST